MVPRPVAVTRVVPPVVCGSIVDDPAPVKLPGRADDPLIVDDVGMLALGLATDDGQNDAFLVPDDPDTELWAHPADNQWAGTVETRESYTRFMAIPAGIAWERWERVTISWSGA